MPFFFKVFGKERALALLSPSAGHRNAAQTLTALSSASSDEADLAVERELIIYCTKQTFNNTSVIFNN